MTGLDCWTLCITLLLNKKLLRELLEVRDIFSVILGVRELLEGGH